MNTDGCKVSLWFEGVAWVAQVDAPGPDVTAQGPDRITALERLVATLRVEIEDCGWDNIPRRNTKTENEMGTSVLKDRMLGYTATEGVAERVYEAMVFATNKEDLPPWTVNGNSHMQNEARAAAMAICEGVWDEVEATVSGLEERALKDKDALLRLHRERKRLETAFVVGIGSLVFVVAMLLLERLT